MTAPAENPRGGDDLDRYIAEQQWDPEFRAAFAAAQARPAGDRAQPTQELSSNDVAVEDVRAIAVTLGLGGHARPYSAHDVVHREILPAIATLHEFAADMINAPDDSAADWGYDLAHRLGLMDVDGT